MLFSGGKHAAEPTERQRLIRLMAACVLAAAVTAGAVLLMLHCLRQPQQPTAAAPTTETTTTTLQAVTQIAATQTVTQTEPQTTTTALPSTTATTTTRPTTTTTKRKTIPSVKPPSIKVESGSVSDDRVVRTTRATTRTTAAGGYRPVRPDRVSLADLPHLYGSGGNLVGIDVSRHNGAIDWSKVKAAGIRYAMIRCGYRTTVGGEVYEDANFRKNVQGALDAGVPVGVYFFSAAKTRTEALEEAAFVLEVIKDYAITWPVVYDFELFGQDRLKGVSDTTVTDNAIAFMDYIAQSGYTPMLYCSRNMLRDNFEVGRLSNYRVWMAQYTELASKQYPAPHVMWQCASDGLVDGIDGWVDLNIAYEDLGRVSSPYVEPKVQTAFGGISFADAWDVVELRLDTNLRISPYLDYPNKYRMTAAGTRLLRTGVDEKSGWSRLECDGVTVYTLSERMIFVAPATTTTTTITTTTTTTRSTTSTAVTTTTTTTTTAATAGSTSLTSDVTTTKTTELGEDEWLPPDVSGDEIQKNH